MAASWRRFDTLAEAEAYCAEQNALANLPAGQVTTAWTAPAPLSDGTYVAAAYSDPLAGPWDASWPPAC